MTDNILLIIEDSSLDYNIMVKAFNKCNFTSPILHCQSEKEALAFIEQGINHFNTSRFILPKLIILDLNLNGVEGTQILHLIRTSNCYQNTPVIIFSSSQNPFEIKKCYEMGANGYVVKPIILEEIYQVISAIYNFWLNTNRII